MNWDLAVSWGREVWVSVSDIGRIGQPELKQSPQATRGKNIYVAPLIKRKIWNYFLKVSFKWSKCRDEMVLYNRFCKRFFAVVIVRLTAQSDSRALLVLTVKGKIKSRLLRQLTAVFRERE